MFPFPAILMGAAAFTPFSTTYTTTGATTVPIPAGATKVTIELVGAGSTGFNFDQETGRSVGGGGGAFSKKIDLSLSGYSSIYLLIPNGNGGPTVARQNSAGGTIVCQAAGNSNSVGGGSTGNCIGDVAFNGGNGSSGTGSAGGGGAGPLGAGGSASGTTPGTNGGGTDGFSGNGGGVTLGGSVSNGIRGWARLTWA